AAGLAAVAARKYERLASLLKETTYHKYTPFRSSDDGKQHSPLAWYLFKYKREYENTFAVALNGQQYTAISDHLSAVLRKPLEEFIPQQTKFDLYFDRFEYLCGLHIYSFSEIKEAPWGPFGSFLRHRRGEASVAKELEREVKRVETMPLW